MSSFHFFSFFFHRLSIFSLGTGVKRPPKTGTQKGAAAQAQKEAMPVWGGFKLAGSPGAAQDGQQQQLQQQQTSLREIQVGGIRL